VTAISAISPPGGDLSEPVTQNTLRVVKVFWGLDSTLARKRHFPSINWMNSYSLHSDVANLYYDQFIEDGVSAVIKKALALLQEEYRLQEIVRLVGFDSISDIDKLKLEIAKSIREDFLQQNAFHDVDQHSSLKKQFKILGLIMDCYEKSLALLEKGHIDFSKYYAETMSIRGKMARVKFTSDDEIDAASREMLKVIERMRIDLREGTEDA